MTATTTSRHAPTDSMSARATRARSRLSNRRSTLTTMSSVDEDPSMVSSYQLTLDESSSHQYNQSSFSTHQWKNPPLSESVVERPSFTSITTPDLLFRVDSMDSVQSDNSTLVALRQRVKELDGLLEELQDNTKEELDEDGMIEELYSLEYAEQKLKQELDAVDMLLSPTLTAEARDATVTTLIQNLDCGEPSFDGGFEIVVDDDNERMPPPLDCLSACSDGSACEAVSGIRNLYTTAMANNAWSKHFMEEEPEEVVFDNNKIPIAREPSDILARRNPRQEENPASQGVSGGKKAERQKVHTSKAPVPDLDILSDIDNMQENFNLLTPCSCFTIESLGTSNPQNDAEEPSTRRKATYREIQILSIPTLDTRREPDTGFFCCAAFGVADDDFDTLFSDGETLSPLPTSPYQSKVTSPLPTSPYQSKVTPFSPICDLNQSKMSPISEAASRDLLSPRHPLSAKARSRIGMHRLVEADNGSSIFAGVSMSKDELTVLSPGTRASAATKKGSNIAKNEKSSKSPENGSSIFDGLLSPCTLLSPCATSSVFNFDKESNIKNANNTQDQSALVSPRASTKALKRFQAKKQKKGTGHTKSKLDIDTGFTGTLETIEDVSATSSSASKSSSPTTRKSLSSKQTRADERSKRTSPRNDFGATEQEYDNSSPLYPSTSSPTSQSSQTTKKALMFKQRKADKGSKRTSPRNHFGATEHDNTNPLYSMKLGERSTSQKSSASSPSKKLVSNTPNKSSQRSKHDASSPCNTIDTTSSRPKDNQQPVSSPTDSLQYELNFGVSVDLLNSSSRPSERTQRTVGTNLQTPFGTSRSRSNDFKQTISSYSTPKSQFGSRTSPRSAPSPKPVDLGKPPVSPKNKTNCQHEVQHVTRVDGSIVSEEPIRKLCFDDGSQENSDYGEIRTPHNAEDTVSPLHSFRSWTNNDDDEDGSLERDPRKPWMKSRRVQRKEEEEQIEPDFQIVETAPTDEMVHSTQSSKTGKSATSMRIVNSYDEPMYFDSHEKAQIEAENDDIVDTLARIYARIQQGKSKKDDPALDIHTIQKSIQSGTFEEDYGGYNNDDNSIHEAISRISKRIQSEKFSPGKENRPRVEKKAEADNAQRSFLGCCDGAIECVLFDDICNAGGTSSSQNKPDNEKCTLPSVASSRSSTLLDGEISYLVDGEKTYVAADMSYVISGQITAPEDVMTYLVDGDAPYQEDVCSVKSLDVGLTEPHVVCLSPRAPKLPLREELPTIGVELIFSKKKAQDSFSAESAEGLSALKERTRRIENVLKLERSPSEASATTVGDLLELKGRKRQIEMGLKLEQSLSLEENDRREIQSPRRKPYRRLFQTCDVNVPNSKIKKTTDMKKLRSKILNPFKNQSTEKHESGPVQRKSGVMDKPNKTGARSYNSIHEQDNDMVNREVETLLRKNKELLTSISKFDYENYQTLVTNDLTGIEPGSKGQIQQQQAFHRYFLDTSTLVDISMVAPRVRFISDGAAVVTYIRSDKAIERDGTLTTKRTSETRIWEKCPGQSKDWVNCHYHQSKAD